MTSAILTPHQIRDRLVEAYMRSYKHAYGHADRAAIEKKVVADMQLVEASKLVAPTSRTRAPRKRIRNVDPVAEFARRNGAALARDARPNDAAPYRPAVLHADPTLISEKWGAAVARIARIVEGTRGATLAEGVSNAEVPKLAARYLETFAFYMTRSKPAPIRGVDHNPFRGLNDKDASRAFMARVMDICDSSTSVLGHWYVK